MHFSRLVFSAALCFIFSVQAASAAGSGGGAGLNAGSGGGGGPDLNEVIELRVVAVQ